MKILKAVIGLIPLQLFIYLMRKRKGELFSDLWPYSDKGSLKLQAIESNQYQHVISVQGYGYSGSGAVVDILREFSDVTVYGSIDADYSGATSKMGYSEFDICRHPGGLFEIERYLNSDNLFFNDAVIKRFLSFIDKRFCKRGNLLYTENFRMNLLRFLNEIVDFSVDNMPSEQFNLHVRTSLSFLKYRYSIFFIKKMSVEEYRCRARYFLNAIFNDFKPNRYLALDQFFSDLGDNYLMKKQYVPNLKTIIVRRDPRDVFLYAHLKRVAWIPSYNVEVFVKWYATMLKNINKNPDEVLVLQLENLILNYDESLAKIKGYLQLDDASHTRKRQFFDPKVSVKNLMLWKDELNKKKFNKELLYIEKELKQWCYNEF